MKYGKSKVLICEIMGFVGYSEKSNIQEASCQKLAFRDKLALRYQPSYALMTPYKSF